MTRKRILFVDDEPAVLAAFRNVLRREQHRWEIVFAAGGPEAARLIQHATFDVVVSDMRMPELDGVQLLELVRQRLPRAVRIMLTGFAESEAVVRALPLVHQFLSKPCDSRTLRGVLERCCEQAELESDRSAGAAVGSVRGLPSHPARYGELRELLDRARCTPAQISSIAARDPAMAAKLLQLANTPQFRGDSGVSSIADAVAIVGVDMIRDLVRERIIFAGAPLAAGFSLEELCEASERCATAARASISERSRAEEAYAAGLLHDIGRLVFAYELRDRYAHVVTTAATSGCTLAKLEQEQFGVTHAEVGAHLLAMWALPPALVEAVGGHHDLGNLPATGCALAAALQPPACAVTESRLHA